MNDFHIRTKDNQTIRFSLYHEAAPITSNAFLKLLPFSRTFFHARVSGKEIWIEDAPILDIIQENASVFAEPGEIVFGPKYPERNQIANYMGVFYGEGKLLDCGNIFGKVLEEDLHLLIDLGDKIWRHGSEELIFAK